MKSKAIPTRIVREYGSPHAFRAAKRADVREAQKVLHRLRMGCAYTPAYKEIDKAIRLIEESREKMAVRNWGR